MPATKEVPLLYHLQVNDKPSGFPCFPTAMHKVFSQKLIVTAAILMRVAHDARQDLHCSLPA